LPKLNDLSSEMNQLQVKEIVEKGVELDFKTQINKESIQKIEENKEDSKLEICEKNNVIESLVALRGFIEECKTFDEALDILNLEGNKNGVAFKKGNIHYIEDKTTIRDRRIVCAKTKRNKAKNADDHRDPKKESYDKLEQIKASQNNKTCPVFYKFVYNENGEMSFEKCDEAHNHPLKISGTELNQKMLQDMHLFNKKSKVIEIKESLEKKYNVQLDYNMVYYEFRKIYPRFGEEDANNMKKILEEKNIYHKFDIDMNTNIVKRLIFATPRMIRNYELYGDIILIDTTYRVNHYNIPLIVYSGVSSTGSNIIFGLSIVNNENEETHEWCLNEFFKIHKKLPNLCVTDQDLALSAVISKRYPQIIHFLCQWHIIQNFKKHFSYLQNMNLKTVYEQILSLPYLSQKQDFENTYQSTINTLKNKKYIKSSKYLEHVYESKLKWAKCYSPDIFTAGIHTTSRIESINAAIKKFVNSNSEISDIFDFLISFENKQISNPLANEDEKNIMIHPILEKMKLALSNYIFSLHYEQYLLCSNYRIDADEFNIRNMQQILPTFKVTNIKAADPQKHRVLTLINNAYKCECETFNQYGIICRHIFYVALIRQEKDLTSIIINPRWLVKDPLDTESLEDLFKNYVPKKNEKEENKEEQKNPDNNETNNNSEEQSLPEEKGFSFFILIET